MPAKIEHKTIENIECKRCSICKMYLPLCDFHRDGGHAWDGLVSSCKKCLQSKRQLDARTRAVRAWGCLNKRVKNGEKTYAKRGIRIEISKDEFINWYQKNSFPHCIVDRINNEKNYTLKNIQMLTLVEHNYKRRSDRLSVIGVTEGENERYCFCCARLMNIEVFGRKKDIVSKANPLGLRQYCKGCNRDKQRKRRIK